MSAMIKARRHRALGQLHPEGRARRHHARRSARRCTIDGKLYSWPFLLDVIGIGLAFGPDDEGGPARRGARDLGRLSWPAPRRSSIPVRRPFGATFDSHGWRSLAPITHSMSTNVYTPEGLFDFTSEPAIEALKLMKKIMAMAQSRHPARRRLRRRRQRHAGRGRLRRPARRLLHQVLQRAAAHGAELGRSEAAAPRRRCRSSPTAKARRCSGRPAARLFKYGKNKEKAAEYIKALTYDQQIWKDSIAGTRDGASRPAAALQVDLCRMGRQQARLDAAVRRPGPRPARQGQGDQQPPVRPAAVRHRQADLGDLPQGRGSRSEGGACRRSSTPSRPR